MLAGISQVVLEEGERKQGLDPNTSPGCDRSALGELKAVTAGKVIGLTSTRSFPSATR